MIKRLYSIVITAAVVATSSCSTFTTMTHTQSRESRVSLTGKAKTEVNIETLSQFDTLQKDSIVIDSGAEVAHADSLKSTIPPIELTHKIELIEIPQFSSEQSAHVMISEFRQQVAFEDKVLSHEELAKSFYYPADGHITSDFGWRGSRMHNGIDVKAYYKDNIYAAFDGVVRVAMYNGGFGNCIVIRHYNGLETVYAHSTKMLVEVNQKVKAGDVIALAGKTGRSTGVHLHFEVRVLGQCLNPNLILDTKNRTLNGRNLYLTMRNGRIFGSNSEDEAVREAEIKEAITRKYYVVRSGDTLSHIARNNKTSIGRICALNNISSRSIIKVGQRLRVR